MGSTISDKWSWSLVKVTAVSKALISPRDQIAHAQRYTSGAIDVRKALIGCRRSPRMRRVYFRVNLSYRPRRSDISAIYRIRCKLVKERPLLNLSYRPHCSDTSAIYRIRCKLVKERPLLNLSYRPHSSDTSAIYRIRCKLVKERPLLNTRMGLSVLTML